MAIKFSVAMCTYNGARYVQEQFDSIAAQTRPPDELIVCDDVSQDETVKIAQSFARTSSFPVRVKVNETTLGSTRNFDQALSLCEGDLIAFSDQDDVWMPQKLREIEKRLLNGAALAFTNGDIVDSSLRSLGRSVWQAVRFGPKEQAQFANGAAFEVLLDHNVVSGCAMAFRAEFKALVRPIPDGLRHDGVPVLHDWWTAILIAAVSELSVIDEQLVKYRQHERQQLGVRPLANATEQASVFASRSNSLQAELIYLSAIRERLSGRSEFEKHVGVMDRLQTHIEHLEMRASLPRARMRRIAPVAHELFARRYHRYSNGLYSAAKDMFVRS
jgi:glycosyltransferase involved in cell wall biosynthesis